MSGATVAESEEATGQTSGKARLSPTLFDLYFSTDHHGGIVRIRERLSQEAFFE